MSKNEYIEDVQSCQFPDDVWYGSEGVSSHDKETSFLLLCMAVGLFADSSEGRVSGLLHVAPRIATWGMSSEFSRLEEWMGQFANCTNITMEFAGGVTGVLRDGNDMTSKYKMMCERVKSASKVIAVAHFKYQEPKVIKYGGEPVYRHVSLMNDERLMIVRNLFASDR